MNNGDFSQPRHQDKSAIFVYWFDFMKEFVQRGIYGIIPVIIEPGLWWVLILVLIGAFFVTGFLALLAFYHYEFYLTDAELVIEKGLFNRQRANIPYERIQTVHLHQNLLQKWLGVKGLKVETAGSQLQETEIKGLEESVAFHLRKTLRREKPKEKTGPDTEETEEKSEEPLVNLSLKELSLVALTDNHLRNGAIILGTVFAIVTQFFPQQSIFNLIDEWTGLSLSQEDLALQILMAVGIFFLIVLLLAFLKHIHWFYDFQSQITQEGFQVKGGLVRRNEYTVPFAKIQFLEWKTNILRKLLDMEAVTIHPAQSHAGENLTEVEIPGCFPDHSTRIMNKVFPEIKGEPLEVFRPHWFYKLFLFNIRFLVALIPAFLLGFYWSYLWAGIFLAVYTLIIGFTVPKYVNAMAVRIFEKGLVFERGWLFPKRTIMKPHKLQAVKMRQNILQRRRSLCHLLVGTAGGHLRFPFFPVKETRVLYNWLIYKVEVHQGSWM